MTAATQTSAEALLGQVVSDLGGEVRPAQQLMVQLVEESLKTPRALLLEAGTGTGKSLGYLSPVFAQLDAEKRVVISTATLALQRQLVNTDIPRICAALQRNGQELPKVALFKGWANYLCRRKISVDESLESLFDAGENETQESARYVSQTGREITALRQWAEETETGDRDDLEIKISNRAWSQASVPTTHCLNRKCEFWDDCFPRLAREKMENATVIVTNHAILGIHANSDIELLPEYEVLIVDEAHELEERVRSQASVSFFPSRLQKTLKSGQKLLNLPVEKAVSLAEKISAILATMALEEVSELDSNLGNHFILLQIELARILDFIPDFEESDNNENYKILVVQAQLKEDLEALDKLGNFNNLRQAMWVGEDGAENRGICLAPLEVGSTIAENLLRHKKAVLTSATLRSCGSFFQIARSLGFSTNQPVVSADEAAPKGIKFLFPPGEDVIYTAKMPDTFDYKKQAFLYVAADLERPTQRGLNDPQLLRLRTLLEASCGGALCLFSSRYAQEQAGEYLASALPYTLFQQGEDNLSSLINSYRSDPESCLLGTISLWQGVDVSGLSSRLVTIDRIPFPRPNDPIISARSRAVAARGGNPFMEVSLSRASLLLAQGTGRLIRSKDDRGVVAILDSRLYTARYRGMLLGSLPNFSASIDEKVVTKLLKHNAKLALG